MIFKYESIRTNVKTLQLTSRCSLYCVMIVNILHFGTVLTNFLGGRCSQIYMSFDSQNVQISSEWILLWWLMLFFIAFITEVVQSKPYHWFLVHFFTLVHPWLGLLHWTNEHPMQRLIDPINMQQPQVHCTQDILRSQ